MCEETELWYDVSKKSCEALGISNNCDSSPNFYLSGVIADLRN